MRKVTIWLLFVFLFYGILYADNQSQNPTNSNTLPSVTPLANLPVVETVSTPSPTPIQPNPIHIVEPYENAHLPAIASTFVCGWVPAGGKLIINGTVVPVHPGGGFVTMVQLSPGLCPINAELQLDGVTYNLTRTVLVAELPQPAPVSPLTIEYVTPRQDQELLPGDYVEVVCKGSPGAKAYFTVNGIRNKFPMFESDSVPGGIYRGVFQVGIKDGFKKFKIKVTLENVDHEKASKESDGTVSLFSNDLPVMAETVSPDTVLRTGWALSPDDKAGYWMFPPLGTLLQITGKIGDEYRVRLTRTKTVWVTANQVKMLPEGTAPARIVAGSISVNADERSTQIRIPLGKKIPFKAQPDAEGKYIDVSFYGAFSNTDWINNATAGVVKNISWFQDDEETYRIRVYTTPNSWWGYDTRYEDGNFVLELRVPPSIVPGNSSLAGLNIAVDAGHSSDSGAIGTTGYAEKDANLALALNLKDKLLAKGANVIMIRQGNENVALADRPKIAWQNKADILISLHNNSLGYGGNPFLKHGFGVYYYTSMSLPLAKEIHTAYQETFANNHDFILPDDGFYYSNLTLTRPSQMPAVLIESAYMIVPAEEAYLKTDSFRSACINAIIQGIERYASSMRPVVKKIK